MKSAYKILLLTICSLFIINGYAISDDMIVHERLLSFETVVPSYISSDRGKLSISKDHYKDGVSSLQWNYQAGATLSIKKDLYFEPKDTNGEDTYLSTFSVWVYNSRASNSQLEFQFLKDAKVCSSFFYNINFVGWRAIYVAYERDMQGSPEEGMNEIRIKAPQISGDLYFDMLLTSAKVDRRHHTPDVHQPFVNNETKNHWLTAYRNSLLPPDDVLYIDKLTETEKEEIALMEERLQDLIVTDTKVTDSSIKALENRFGKYQIFYNNDQIQGLPLFYIYYVEAYERLISNWDRNYHRIKGQEFRDYFTLMSQIANSYVNAEQAQHKSKLKNMFLLMYDHAKDQGVDYGSNMGNFTHYGYSFRNFFTAYFLMKDVLSETGRLEEASKALQWYAQTNETFIEPLKNGVDMDSFNTFSMGRICSILIMEDSPEKAQYIRAFSRWLDTGCKPASGLDGAFKVDGSAFHHRNNYPAYAVGGLDGATNMLYVLSRTSFAISEQAHQTVKDVLLTMRFYCNTSHFPLSMSGRHPDGKGMLVPMHYARMAVSGTPDRTEDIDIDMAAAYLRLALSNSDDIPEYMPKINKSEFLKISELFTSQGIEPETEPQGNKAMGYASVSVQRRSNWSAVVRGHSRYLWAAEHYQGANLYGRYLAHGSMQILTAEADKRVTPATSAWMEEGFDWGRISGTTAIHLPLDLLKANVLNVDTYSGYEEMLYSDETFAGGLSQNAENGLYAMKLHEHDKYNGTHRARKSFHFFDDRIICLGSDIENLNNEYDTETTVFQVAVLTKQDEDYWNNYQQQKEFWIDHVGTGYYIPQYKTNKVFFEFNKEQKSRYQNTGESNIGKWVTLGLNHGKSPKNQSYEYVVLPQVKDNKVDRNKVEKSYKVIQHNAEAHIVEDKLTKTTSFAFFETPKSVSHALIARVDTACLMMINQSSSNTLTLTVANPDLALYCGVSDEDFDNDGRRVERSIYSRPWISNESQEVPVNVVLKGKWKDNENNPLVDVHSEGNETTLSFKCKDAASIDVQLTRL